MSSKNQLISWFLKNRKALPWRPEDPYFRNDYLFGLAKSCYSKLKWPLFGHFSLDLRFPKISDLAKASERTFYPIGKGLDIILEQKIF